MHDSTGDQRLAGATYIGNELLWLWQPKPKKCRKQLNGHLSFQTTIMNRLKSTFPPHLCKKIKFVPDSRQPFENGRIFNLAVGLSSGQKKYFVNARKKFWITVKTSIYTRTLGALKKINSWKTRWSFVFWTATAIQTIFSDLIDLFPRLDG